MKPRGLSRVLDAFAQLAKQARIKPPVTPRLPNANFPTVPELPKVKLPTVPELPPTVFVCGVRGCGQKVGNYRPERAPDLGMPHDGPITCPKHGPLHDPDVKLWHAEWTRRGRPDRLFLPLDQVSQVS